jgi:hypothetical protein
MNFAIDLGGRVDTTPPCPAAGQAVATLANVEQSQNKKGTGHNLVLKFTLDNETIALPAPDGTTKRCAPGYAITEWLPLQQSDNPKAPDFRVKLCRIYDALAGTTDDTRPNNLPFGALLGKKVILTLEPENSPEFGFNPRIKKFTFLNQS